VDGNVELEHVPGVIDAARNFMESLVNIYGPVGALLTIAGVATVIFGWRIYQQRRQDKAHQAVVDAKEETIQRMAAESRELRIALLMLHGWTDEQVERFVQKGDYKNGPQARRALEGDRRPPSPSSKSTKGSSRKVK